MTKRLIAQLHALSASVVITAGSSCEFGLKDEDLALATPRKYSNSCSSLRENVDEVHQLAVGHRTWVWKRVHGLRGTAVRDFDTAGNEISARWISIEARPARHYRRTR